MLMKLKLLGLLMLAAIVPGQVGCAALTAQRVTSFVAQQAAEKAAEEAGKKAIEKMKDDQAQKDAQKKQDEPPQQ